MRINAKAAVIIACKALIRPKTDKRFQGPYIGWNGLVQLIVV